MKRIKAKVKKATIPNDRVRDVSVQVYCTRLGKAGTARMLSDDDDGGAALRDRAGAYDTLTRIYMDIFKIK